MTGLTLWVRSEPRVEQTSVMQVVMATGPAIAADRRSPSVDLRAE